jgi:hypothetical protein
MAAKYSFQMIYLQNIDSKWFIGADIKESPGFWPGLFTSISILDD